MTEVRVGDRVRITYEGVVKSERYGTWELDSGTFLPAESVHPRTVEVIERAKPKVGDTVSGERNYDVLPVGTVLQNSSHYYDSDPIVKTAKGWYTPATDQHRGHGYYSDPRTIKYLPE